MLRSYVHFAYSCRCLRSYSPLTLANASLQLTYHLLLLSKTEQSMSTPQLLCCKPAIWQTGNLNTFHVGLKHSTFYRSSWGEIMPLTHQNSSSLPKESKGKRSYSTGGQGPGYSNNRRFRARRKVPFGDASPKLKTISKQSWVRRKR